MQTVDTEIYMTDALQSVLGRHILDNISESYLNVRYFKPHMAPDIFFFFFIDWYPICTGSHGTPKPTNEIAHFKSSSESRVCP